MSKLLYNTEIINRINIDRFSLITEDSTLVFEEDEYAWNYFSREPVILETDTLICEYN